MQGVGIKEFKSYSLRLFLSNTLSNQIVQLNLIYKVSYYSRTINGYQFKNTKVTTKN